jgi:hypothetical protein
VRYSKQLWEISSYIRVESRTRWTLEAWWISCMQMRWKTNESRMPWKSMTFLDDKYAFMRKLFCIRWPRWKLNLRNELHFYCCGIQRTVSFKFKHSQSRPKSLRNSKRKKLWTCSFSRMAIQKAKREKLSYQLGGWWNFKNILGLASCAMMSRNFNAIISYQALRCLIFLEKMKI